MEKLQEVCQQIECKGLDSKCPGDKECPIIQHIIRNTEVYNND